jgi:hypothetical protein
MQQLHTPGPWNPARMLRSAYLLLVVAVAALVLVGFLVAELLHAPLLEDPAGYLHGGGLSAALLGVGLLVADVVAPVPSSLVMITLGALYGFAPAVGEPMVIEVEHAAHLGGEVGVRAGLPRFGRLPGDAAFVQDPPHRLDVDR